MTGYNMAAGYLAMNGTAPNTAAGLNVAIGARAMEDLTTGDVNYALGVDALRDVTTGSRNVALGFRALGGSDFYGPGLTTGNRNMAIGHYSLGLTTGDKNTAIGENTAFYNTTGTKNTFIGSYSGYNNNGDNNIAIGEKAMFGGYLGTSSVTGVHNIAIGQYTLQDLTTGNNNIAIGRNALQNITTAQGEVGIGLNALQANVTGAANVAVGNEALKVNTGNGSTAIGSQTLLSSTNGGNTAVGREAGKDVTTGTGNTLIGAYAGNSGTNDLTTGSNNTLIGNEAAATSATVSDQVTIGNTSVSNFRIPGIGLDATDDRFKVTGHFAGSAPVTITGDNTVGDSTYWLINNKSGSTCTLTLPTASSWTGRMLHVQNVQPQSVISASSNVLPLAGGSPGTAILPAVDGAWATLVSDGTNWVITEQSQPASTLQTLSSSTVTVANTTTETDLLSYSLSDVAANQVYRLVAYGTALHNNSSSANLTVRFKIGSTTVLETPSLAMGATANTERREWRSVVDVAFTSTTAQKVSAAWQMSNRTSNSWGIQTDNVNTIGYGTSSEDFATAKNLILSVQFSAALANQDIVLEGYYIEKIV